MSTYFKPWKGTDYKEGIKGNTILVIGVQHWCDPSSWNCEEKTPHDCLKKRDKTCTVWNKKTNKEMELCPLKEICQKNKDNGVLKLSDEGCLEGDFRFLHCETKIAIYDHLHNKIKRAQVFECLIDALTSLFGNSGNSNYFDKIVFSNYIQHYTEFYRNGRLNPEELKLTPETDKYRFKECLKLFENQKPDVIIVLQEEKILEKIKEIVKESYVHLDLKDEPKSFYILASRQSQLYKKSYIDEINNFIKYHTQNWTKKGSTTRDIEVLALFIETYIYKEDNKSMKEIRKQIVELCPLEIKTSYYKNGDFNDEKLRYISSNKNKTPITKEQIDEIKRKYDEYKTGSKSE